VNNQAKAVLWIGLILIVAQLATQWQTIKGIIFKPSSGTTGTGGISPPSLGILTPGLFNPLYPGGPFSFLASTPGNRRATKTPPSGIYPAGVM
jgi:hypothetical protein